VNRKNGTGTIHAKVSARIFCRDNQFGCNAAGGVCEIPATSSASFPAK